MPLCPKKKPIKCSKNSKSQYPYTRSAFPLFPSLFLLLSEGGARPQELPNTGRSSWSNHTVPPPSSSLLSPSPPPISSLSLYFLLPLSSNPTPYLKSLNQIRPSSLYRIIVKMEQLRWRRRSRRPKLRSKELIPNLKRPVTQSKKSVSKKIFFLVWLVCFVGVLIFQCI